MLAWYDVSLLGNSFGCHSYKHGFVFGGQDIDCGSFLDSFMGQAIQDGVLSMDAVDTALTHLFSVQFRLGMFDPSSMQPYTKIPASVVNSPAHQALALDAARQGIVLLKNDGVLPWKSSSLKTVAIIGPNGALVGACMCCVCRQFGTKGCFCFSCS
jgi:beta-glucosidase-like glycosyl hydrolase